MTAAAAPAISSAIKIAEGITSGSFRLFGSFP
jgi:hypothetical protein